MKNCPYCGKEYPDEATHCLLDNTPLMGEVPPFVVEAPIPLVEKTSSTAPPPPLPPPLLVQPRFTERQMLVFEVVLVCGLAFGSYIISAGYRLWFGFAPIPDSHTTAYGMYRWLYSGVHEVTILALLWYLLARRGRNFSSIGLNWAWQDVGWSVLLWFGGSIAFKAIYAFIYVLGLTSVPRLTASGQVGDTLFGTGISLMTILFQFVNPFFEELVVRAYLMTGIKALTNSALVAIVISTVLQTSYHLYQGVPMALSISGLFFIYSIFYAKTNRITPIILAHLYTDVLGTIWYFYRH